MPVISAFFMGLVSHACKPGILLSSAASGKGGAPGEWRIASRAGWPLAGSREGVAAPGRRRGWDGVATTPGTGGPVTVQRAGKPAQAGTGRCRAAARAVYRAMVWSHMLESRKWLLGAGRSGAASQARVAASSAAASPGATRPCG